MGGPGKGIVPTGAFFKKTPITSLGNPSGLPIVYENKHNIKKIYFFNN
jgi:hypothetical protein